MVIKYSNIKTLKKLFNDTDTYNYWFNFLISNFKIKTTLNNFVNSNVEINFFRFFFWFFLTNQTNSSNFLLFYKKFKYCLLYFKLLIYLKKNNINYYNVINLNKSLISKKLNFLLSNKNVSIIFTYSNDYITLNNKIVYINGLDMKIVKLYNYFLMTM